MTPPKRPTAAESREGELMNQLAAARDREAFTAEKVESLTTRLDEAVQDRDAWRTAHRSDAEAEALDACVRALDKLAERGRGGTLSGMRSTTSAAMDRILRYLADRYGVTWYDPPAMHVELADTPENWSRSQGFVSVGQINGRTVYAPAGDL